MFVQEVKTLVRRVTEILTVKGGISWDGDPLHYGCRHNMPLRPIQLFFQLHPQAARMFNAHVETPLKLSCCCSSPAVPYEAVELLLDTCPESIKVADSDGYLPFHSACSYSCMPSRQEHEGQARLHWA
jgi:hypothetical protein